MAPKGKTPAQMQAEADAEAARKKALDDAAAAEKKQRDDDFKALQGSLQNLTTQMAEIGGRVNVLATDRTAPTPTINKGFQRTVSIEEIERAIDEGDNKKANSLQLKYNTETIQEQMSGVSLQIQALQDQGISMIASVVKDQVSGKLPYYERFKKEIDEFLEKAPASSRTSPEMHKWAHDAVVGRHTTELLAEAGDAAVRKHMDGGGGYKPGQGGGGGETGGAGDLTIDTVYGDDAKDIKRLLKEKNISMEQYAQRRGYATAQAYLAHVKKFREDERLEAM